MPAKLLCAGEITNTTAATATLDTETQATARSGLRHDPRQDAEQSEGGERR
jgi:hypothetical protein